MISFYPSNSKHPQILISTANPPIVKMKKKGEKIAVISRTVGINRPDIYRILQRVKDGDIKLSA